MVGGLDGCAQRSRQQAGMRLRPQCRAVGGRIRWRLAPAFFCLVPPNTQALCDHRFTVLNGTEGGRKSAARGRPRRSSRRSLLSSLLLPSLSTPSLSLLS